MDRCGRALEYLAVGHLTIDVGAGGDTALGGAALYAATTAAALGLTVGIATRADTGLLAAGRVASVDARGLPGRCTTTFAHRIGEDGTRRLRLLARAPDISAGDLPPEWRRAGVLHVAPVMGELSDGVMDEVTAEFVGVTPQGWLRRAAEGGVVQATAWDVPTGIQQRADAVVLSTEDLAAEDRPARELARLVPLMVITDGARGAVAWTGGRCLHQPACPARPVDPTGAGDTFAAALFSRLWEGADLEAALRFASAAAAFAVETVGVGGLPGRAAIERRSRLAPPAALVSEPGA